MQQCFKNREEYHHRHENDGAADIGQEENFAEHRHDHRLQKMGESQPTKNATKTMGVMRKWLARIDNQSNLQRFRCKMVNNESEMVAMAPARNKAKK